MDIALKDVFEFMLGYQEEGALSEMSPWSLIQHVVVSRTHVRGILEVTSSKQQVMPRGRRCAQVGRTVPMTM